VSFLDGCDFYWLVSPCKVPSAIKDLARNAMFLGHWMAYVNLLFLITLFRQLPNGYPDDRKLTRVHWSVQNSDKEFKIFTRNTRDSTERFGSACEPKGSLSVPILCRLVFTTMEDFGRQTRLQSRCFMQEAALVSPCCTVPEKSAEISVALWATLTCHCVL